MRPERLLPFVAHPPQPAAARRAAHRRGAGFGHQARALVISERLFYHGYMAAVEPRLADVDYLEVQCKSALNPVKNMGFAWSLNPYTGCEHRCAFCYVRAFHLRAIQKLVAAGIDVGVGMAPILPGLSDRPEQLEAVVKAARAAGATGLWANMLHLKDGTREHFMSVLSRHWPELVPRYEHAYRNRAYLPPSYGENTMQEVKRLRSHHGVSDRRRVILKPPPQPEQLAFLN